MGFAPQHPSAKIAQKSAISKALWQKNHTDLWHLAGRGFLERQGLEAQAIDLAAGQPGQAIGVENATRHLLGPQPGAAMPGEFVMIEATASHDKRDDFLADARDWSAYHRSLGHLRMRHEHTFDLGGENLRPAAAHDLASPAAEMQVSVRVEKADIASVAPAAFDTLAAAALILGAWATRKKRATANRSRHAGRQRLAAGAHDLDLDPWHRATDRVRPQYHIDRIELRQKSAGGRAVTIAKIRRDARGDRALLFRVQQLPGGFEPQAWEKETGWRRGAEEKPAGIRGDR
jgi:hypothetical protein